MNIWAEIFVCRNVFKPWVHFENKYYKLSYFTFACILVYASAHTCSHICGYTYVHTWACVCAHEYGCMWRLKDNLRCCFSRVMCLFWDWVSHEDLEWPNLVNICSFSGKSSTRKRLCDYHIRLNIIVAMLKALASHSNHCILASECHYVFLTMVAIISKIVHFFSCMDCMSLIMPQWSLCVEHGACGGQKLMLGVFLNHSTPYFKKLLHFIGGAQNTPLCS